MVDEIVLCWPSAFEAARCNGRPLTKPPDHIEVQEERLAAAAPTPAPADRVVTVEVRTWDASGKDHPTHVVMVIDASGSRGSPAITEDETGLIGIGITTAAGTTPHAVRLTVAPAIQAVRVTSTAIVPQGSYLVCWLTVSGVELPGSMTVIQAVETMDVLEVVCDWAA